MKADSYSVTNATTGKPFRRGPCIWVTSGNVVSPVCYLRKPAWLAESDFAAICAAIRLDLPAGYELKGAGK